MEAGGLPRHGGRMSFAAPRALLATTTLLVALAVAPVSGASAAQSRAVPAPDGLRARPDVAPAKARAAQAPATDPRTEEQWPLQGDAPMGAASAWRQTTGGDVTVAIVDSGIDLGHPDLIGNLWTNPGEVPGNGVDDDGNGYVDDVHGYDFVDGDATPQDANGHGTHVAGIVAARGGNGIGVSGVAWRARLMAVRVLDAGARGNTTTVAQGIRYAVDNGARIVNLSLAGPSPAGDLEDAVRYAQQRGVLIVVAAGNDGRDLDAAPTYPAAYPEPNVLGVAAPAPPPPDPTPPGPPPPRAGGGALPPPVLRPRPPPPPPGGGNPPPPRGGRQGGAARPREARPRRDRRPGPAGLRPPRPRRRR